MEIKVPIMAALIGTLGGLIGGGVTSVANHFFGLEASRQELLQEARRQTYAKWSEVRTLSRQIDEEKDPIEAERIQQQYTLQGREVMANIAVFGGKNVAESAAMWYRVGLKPCTAKSLKFKKTMEAEINLHHAMRDDLLENEEAVSDAVMSILLWQCGMPIQIEANGEPSA